MPYDNHNTTYVILIHIESPSPPQAWTPARVQDLLESLHVGLESLGDRGDVMRALQPAAQTYLRQWFMRTLEKPDRVCDTLFLL